MAYAAALFNKVLDVVKAAATDDTIAVDPLRVFQDSLPEANGELPAVVVALPPEPYDAGDWAGSGNLKQAFFKVLVEILDEMPTTGDYPYGQSGQATGILNLTDAVLNVLENARGDFMPASPSYVDHQLTAAVFKSSAPGKAAAIITVNFKVRFIAGSR